MSDFSAQQPNSILFLARLENLSTGDRAILKRSAGKSLAEAQKAYVTYYSLIRDMVLDERNEQIFWLVSTYFPVVASSPKGDFGSALRKARTTKTEKGLDRRVTALLDADDAQLAYRLGGCLRFLHSQRIAVNWLSLIDDLRRWHYPERPIQRRWAEAYFALPERKIKSA